MTLLLTCAMIAEDVYHARPTIVVGYRPVTVPDRERYCRGMDFGGGAYAGRDHVGIVAFRGSAEMEDWKDANLQIVRRRMPVGHFGNALGFFAAAHRALEQAGCSRFLVVGHSLGGGLAAIVAGAVTWVPVRGITFNAPGLRDFALKDASCNFGCPNEENVFNFRSGADVVSRWGTHIGAVYDVPGAGVHGIGTFIDCLSGCEFGSWEL